jgi:hypothetical protein
MLGIGLNPAEYGAQYLTRLPNGQNGLRLCLFSRHQAILQKVNEHVEPMGEQG